MSYTCQYLSDCKRYFEKKYIVPLPTFHFAKFALWSGIITGISWRIYHDGFTSNALLPIWFSKTITFSSCMIMCVIACVVGFGIGSYIDSVKDKYYYEEHGNYPWRPPLRIQIKDAYNYYIEQYPYLFWSSPPRHKSMAKRY